MGSRCSGRWVAATVVLSSALWWPAGALGNAPNLEFALQAVGEQAEERREGPWSAVIVDEGLQSLEQTGGDSTELVFGEGDSAVAVGADGEPPWSLVFAAMWAAEPGQYFSELGLSGRTTGRYEVIGDRLAVCYGDGAMICVDELFREVIVARARVEGVTWEVRATEGTQSLSVTADGAQQARFNRRRR